MSFTASSAPDRLTPRSLHARATRWLQDGRAACIVSVDDIRGSTPRDQDARMLVTPDEVRGTVGGGHLEWRAIDLARQALREGLPAESWTHTFPLGPTLGQCCGGIVTLRFEALSDTSLAAWQVPPPRFHVELHGAGHVGQAIVKLLSDLDCSVRWIDERADDLPQWDAQAGLPAPEQLAALPDHIQWLPTEAAEREVLDAPPNACHLVLTHRHDLDLKIIDAVLRRGDFRFAGLIGSQTKRARFLHRLAEQGISAATLNRLTCPIGLPDIQGKEPAVIAIAMVAQLLAAHAA
ncbi:MAG: xanthine dehydrogenase accessory protein XdhC [Aquabacterium sp.]|jgi:xanthine dehydrogenase accessory factor|uniref:xanthine dehydrogenase accessory protein XdhC n=1 Tax=Aquabacterium sp. TaxID=1872578 RepID=UPI002A35EF44|nr:xanthine dehydrogenase accessory protein XdhC [Aquabacterium sp.]MDX9844378.1 xanthine dehydrogenase accessory protein XdhC [Aquabacterium sp.]